VREGLAVRQGVGQERQHGALEISQCPRNRKCNYQHT
jgi:hypothetical protein